MTLCVKYAVSGLRVRGQCLDRTFLSQKKMTNLELRKIRIALTALSSKPELDYFTALEL